MAIVKLDRDWRAHGSNQLNQVLTTTVIYYSDTDTIEAIIQGPVAANSAEDTVLPQHGDD